jgi:hypothetical protein
MKTTVLALLFPVLLVGCGVPAGGPQSLPSNASGGFKAVSEQRRNTELRVPAAVMGYVKQAVDQVTHDYSQEYVKDMYGRPMHPKYRVEFSSSSRSDLKVVTSRDGFKTKLEEVSMYRVRGYDRGEMVVPYFDIPGEVSYYLQVEVSILSTSTGKLVKRLPVTTISNYGQNFKASLLPVR